MSDTVPTKLTPESDETKTTEQTNAATSPVVNDSAMPETADDQEDNVEADEDPAVKTLRDAFPDLDVDIIKAILATHDGNVELSFEALLAMSDPDYQTTPGANDDLLAKSQQEKDDELLARQLAQEYDQQLRQQDQQRHQDSGPAFNFQEELPVIKERVIEAGAAAKKKILGFYNSFMEQATASEGSSTQQQRYPSGEHSLSNDLSSMHISSPGGPGKPQVEDDAAFARRLAMEDAQLERLAAQRRRQQDQPNQENNAAPATRPSRIETVEENEVTFTSPGHDLDHGYTVQNEITLDKPKKKE